MGFVHGNMLQEKQLNKPTMKAAKKVRCFMRNSFSFHFKLKAVMGAEQGVGAHLRKSPAAAIAHNTARSFTIPNVQKNIVPTYVKCGKVSKTKLIQSVS